MPIIEVTLTQGRTPEQLRAMIHELTNSLVTTGVAKKESIRVVVREIPKTHFAAADETLAERAERQAAENQS